jgi:hypothetical protein
MYVKKINEMLQKLKKETENEEIIKLFEEMILIHQLENERNTKYINILKSKLNENEKKHKFKRFKSYDNKLKREVKSLTSISRERIEIHDTIKLFLQSITTFEGSNEVVDTIKETLTKDISYLIKSLKIMQIYENNYEINKLSKDLEKLRDLNLHLYKKNISVKITEETKNLYIKIKCQMEVCLKLEEKKVEFNKKEKKEENRIQELKMVDENNETEFTKEEDKTNITEEKTIEEDKYNLTDEKTIFSMDERTNITEKEINLSDDEKETNIKTETEVYTEGRVEDISTFNDESTAFDDEEVINVTLNNSFNILGNEEIKKIKEKLIEKTNNKNKPNSFELKKFIANNKITKLLNKNKNKEIITIDVKDCHQKIIVVSRNNEERKKDETKKPENEEKMINEDNLVIPYESNMNENLEKLMKKKFPEKYQEIKKKHNSIGITSKEKNEGKILNDLMTGNSPNLEKIMKKKFPEKYRDIKRKTLTKYDIEIINKSKNNEILKINKNNNFLNEDNYKFENSNNNNLDLNFNIKNIEEMN